MFSNVVSVKVDQILLKLCALGLLAGCGGGGSSEPVVISTPVPVTSSAPAVKPLFDENPLVLYDAVSYYADQCDRPQVSFVVPLDINVDNYKDFVVHLWCERPYETWGEHYEGVTPDLLVAYVSDDYGNYRIENKAVFGESYPRLNGASRKYAVGDLNSDGIDDIAFALNREDGRGYDDYTTNLSTQAVLLSSTATFDVSYEIYSVGAPTWAHAVDIVDNTVIFAGFMENAVQAFRFDGLDWNDVTDEYPATPHWANTFRFAGSNRIVASDYKEDGSAQGMSMYVKGEQWELADSAWVPIDRVIPFITYNHEESFADIVKLNGQEYFGLGVDELCVNNDILVVKLSGAQTQDGVILDGVLYHQNDLVPVNMLEVFDISDNQFNHMPNAIPEQNKISNFNFFSCNDINNDGYFDIVQNTFSNADNMKGGVPEIYVNNGNNVLYTYDTSEFPVLVNDDNAQGYLEDINYDGLVDMVLMPLKAGYTDIEIYTTTDYIE